MATQVRKAVSQITDVVFPPPKDYTDKQRQDLISTGLIFKFSDIV